MVGHTRRAAVDTDLLPPAVDRKGADGNLLSLAVMRDAILWLAGLQRRTYGRTLCRAIVGWAGCSAGRFGSETPDHVTMAPQNRKRPFSAISTG
jgi:hypothetical protein